MRYFLKTRFGESTDSYSGTCASPNSDLGQGSGASPPGLIVLSSLIINAYRCMGHGAKSRSPYAQRLFHLPAVMYIDDTDLLHWPELSTTESDK
jgi:hypothetical protein